MRALFTDLEQLLIELIPFDKKIDSTKLVELYFKDDVPMNARPIIIGRLKMIAKKAEYAKLDWRLMKTPRSGPIPQSFWREMKQ